jgi:hypothetical protein
VKTMAIPLVTSGHLSETASIRRVIVAAATRWRSAPTSWLCIIHTLGTKVIKLIHPRLRGEIAPQASTAPHLGFLISTTVTITA